MKIEKALIKRFITVAVIILIGIFTTLTIRGTGDRKLSRFISGHTFKYQNARIWMRFEKNHTGWYESLVSPNRIYWKFFWKVRNQKIIYGTSKSKMDSSKYVADFKKDYMIINKEELHQTKLFRVH